MYAQNKNQKTTNFPGFAAPLDTLTKSASTLSSTAFLEQAKKLVRSAEGRRRSWELRKAAGLILPGARVGMCGKNIIPGKEVTVLQQSDRRASFGNIQKCGSVWVCAVCQYKIALERVAEVERAVRSAHARGLVVVFLTLTAGHSRFDSLEALAAAQAKARRALFSGRGGVARREKFGIVGSIANLEVTWGQKTGWHPHSHVLLFCEPDNLDEFADDFWRGWKQAATSAGLRVNRAGFDCRVVDGTDSARAATYIGKPGSGNWGVGRELASGQKIAGYERYTPFELLHEFIDTGDLDRAEKFVEYAEVFHGRRQLFWSRGLRDLLVLDEEEDDEVVANAEGVGEVVGVLTPADWAQLVRTKQRLRFLERVEQSDFDTACREILSG